MQHGGMQWVMWCTLGTNKIWRRYEARRWDGYTFIHTYVSYIIIPYCHDNGHVNGGVYLDTRDLLTSSKDIPREKWHSDTIIGTYMEYLWLDCKPNIRQTKASNSLIVSLKAGKPDIQHRQWITQLWQQRWRRYTNSSSAECVEALPLLLEDSAKSTFIYI